MDYEQMGVQELRAECQARGLGAARSKAELIEKLTGHDAQQPSLAEGEYVMSREAVMKEAEAADLRLPETAPLTAFRKTFPAEPGGPDEETHLAYRQATIQAAVEAGLVTRGDARLAEAGGDTWVYEVSVRQRTLS